MNILARVPDVPAQPPDHTQLPETDGSIVQNFQEHPQAMLLTDSITPTLRRVHPDGQYAIGQDSGIYWRWTDPPLDGCKAPDWYYIPGVSPMLHGGFRRSYVLWQEGIAPRLLIEFVSGDGSEERDPTPHQGKFWVYEQGIRAPYYAIYEVDPGRVEVHHLVNGRYELLAANERGHYPIAPLGLELGIWQGTYQNMDLPWLRWWDDHGNLLLTGDERTEQAQRATEQERLAREQAQRATEQERLAKEQAQREVERLAARLRALGIDPDSP
jgi:Uma2 family endonuclease